MSDATAQQLSRLTAKGCQITGAGHGGIAELTQSDIAAGLAGLRDPVYWYMRIKFCGDESLIPDLRTAIAYKMLRDSINAEVDLSMRTARGLALTAVIQATIGPLCHCCRGTGIMITTNSASDCTACKGTGRVPMTQARAAELAGVHRNTYARKYERIVNRYVSELEGYESQGFSHIRRRLFGADG